MSSQVLAYHPGTGQTLAMTDEQLNHLRASGWVLKSEHDQREAEAAEREAEAAEREAAPLRTARTDLPRAGQVKGAEGADEEK